MIDPDNAERWLTSTGAEPFAPKPKKKKPMREKRVERSHKDGIAAAGGWSLKWVSPGISGVPDDIDLHGVDAMMKLFRDTDDGREAYLYDDDALRAFLVRLLGAAITFTECKAPGKKPTPLQERVHARLRALGFTVNVVDQLRK